ncbi:MAG: hypothetical protein ACOYZ6_11415 [Chloroflexota bacterium]
MRKPFMILFGIVIFTSGCINQGTQTPMNPPIRSKPSAAVINTQMPIQPTWTPTLVKPTRTSIPRLNHLDIPKWASDSNVDVLLLPIGDFFQFKNFALVNSDSGEIYNLPELHHGGYFWMNDGKHFGILSLDESEITLVDITTGEVTYHHPSKKAVQYVDVDTETTYSYQAIGEKVEDPGFMLVYPWWDVSANGHYLVLENPYYDPGYTRVLDLRTDEIITLTDANDGIFDIDREWSPTEAYLGIVHSDAEPGLGFGFEKKPNFSLKIYDIERGKVISVYKNIPSISWSADSRKILYQPWTESLHNEFQYRQNPPCVFDIITGITKCYNEASVRHTTSTTYLLELGFMQWSPDGKRLGYIYYRAENKSRDSYIEEHGGICLITIENNSVNCVLERFEGNKQNKKPIDYWWSPNGRHLAFIISETSPYSDDTGNPEFGILNIARGEYIIIKKQNPFRFDVSSWRPKISQ